MCEARSESAVLDPGGWIDWVKPVEWLDVVAWGVKVLLCGRVCMWLGWWVLFSLFKENSMSGKEFSELVTDFMSWRQGIVRGSEGHITLPKSTSIMDRSLEDSFVLATFQSGNSLKLNIRGLSPPFRPSGEILLGSALQ